MAESWFSTRKEELIYSQSWPTRSLAQRAIFEFIEGWYDRQRLHSSPGNLTPVEYERRRTASARKETQAA
jgi:transposase InsO family protein